MKWQPKRAFLSVSDKTGLIELAQFFHKKGVELIATGGTEKTLLEAKLPCTPIQTITGNPEVLGGRMKSLSFPLSSGILYRRGHESDELDMKNCNFRGIDIVVINFYPFTKGRLEKKSRMELIELIDIGGPSSLRAAAKNFDHVLALCDPADYTNIIKEWTDTDDVSLATREKCALKSFSVLAQDALDVAFGLSQTENFHTELHLRYGENPQQKATFLPLAGRDEEMRSIQGKELSYNNVLDATAAWECAVELSEISKLPTVAVIKHGLPCGVASHSNLLAALQAAWDADSVSAFGGVLAFSHEITTAEAEFFSNVFVEVIIAPKFTAEALAIFAKKKNVRLLEWKKPTPARLHVRSVHGGLLIQEPDLTLEAKFEIVSGSNVDLALARYGEGLVKHSRSNALVLVSRFTKNENEGFTLVSSGQGQPNRFDCLTMLALPRALARNWDLSKTLLASDAFFPFDDIAKAAKSAKIPTLVQPGGSIRDGEIIESCKKMNLNMVFTGERHFKH